MHKSSILRMKKGLCLSGILWIRLKLGVVAKTVWQKTGGQTNAIATICLFDNIVPIYSIT